MCLTSILLTVPLLYVVLLLVDPPLMYTLLRPSSACRTVTGHGNTSPINILVLVLCEESIILLTCIGTYAVLITHASLHDTPQAVSMSVSFGHLVWTLLHVARGTTRRNVLVLYKCVIDLIICSALPPVLGLGSTYIFTMYISRVLYHFTHNYVICIYCRKRYICTSQCRPR